MKRFVFAALCPVFVAAALLPLCAQAQAPAALAPPPPLPGVQSLYAHQGDNSIIAYATPDGYANVRTLVRHLNGDLDIIRTDVRVVVLPAGTVSSLGPGVSNAALLAAFQTGRGSASAHLRLTTREDTPIAALLRVPGDDALPLSLVPREAADGTLSIELLQPAALSMTVSAGGMFVARLPDQPGGAVRLLLLAPTLLPSGSRTER